MPNAFERLWERMERRADIGGQALYEIRLRAEEWYGEGGEKLTEAQKIELFNRAYDDPTGQIFEDTIRARQKAKGLEGSKDIPQDFLAWAKKGQERRQAAGDGQ